MTDINKLEVHWEKISYKVGTKISCDMEKIREWGIPQFLPSDPMLRVFVEFDDEKCKIQIYDIKFYTGTTFPTDLMKKEIAKSLVEFHRKYGSKFKKLLLDSDYKLFAAKNEYADPWYYLGEEGGDWEILSFTKFQAWFAENGKGLNTQDFWFRMGNQVFRCTDTSFEKVLGVIVLHDYCDRYVPKVDGEVKQVSFGGFSTLLMYLKKIMGDYRSVHTNTLRTLYKDFEKSKVIPVIPVKWRTDDIELMNTKRLDLLVQELDSVLDAEKEKEKEEDDKEEEDLKKSQENSSEDLEKNTQKMSGEDSIISKMLKDAKELINNQIELAKSDKDSKSVASNDVIKLSEILSGQILLSSGIWGSEYLVNIDTNITESGISISEHEMLVAIICYGLLEIMVEETVSRKLMTEMEDRIEEKYGIGCHLISPTDDLAEDMLKRGKEIHASN